LTVEALAVDTSARKSKREKRLFRLNVPTAICTSLLTRRNGRLYFMRWKSRRATLRAFSAASSLGCSGGKARRIGVMTYNHRGDR
jgi:hypothetical protein